MEIRLVCTKCKTIIANRNQFGIFQDGFSKHVFLKTLTVHVEKKPLQSPNEKKLFLIHCKNCGSRLGSEYKVKFSNKSPSNYFLDSELCSISRKNLEEQEIIILKKWKFTNEAQIVCINPEFCKHFSKFGTCKFGSKCKYYHDLNKKKKEGSSKRFNKSKERHKFAYSNQSKHLKRGKKEDEDEIPIFQTNKKRRVRKGSFFPFRLFNRKKYFVNDLRTLKKSYEGKLLEILGGEEFTKRVLDNKEIQISDSTLIDEVVDVVLFAIKNNPLREVEAIKVVERILDSNIFVFFSFYIKDIILVSQLTNIIQFFEIALKKSDHSKINILPIQEIKDLIVNSTREEFLSHLEKVEMLLKTRENFQVMKSRAERKEKENTNWIKKGLDEKEFQDLIYSLPYLPIIPTKKDLQENLFNLPLNKDTWTKKEEYLYTQFVLLKEDFLGTMKEGINQYLNNELDSRDMHIYNKIEFISYGDDKRNIREIQISFDVPFKKSKRDKRMFLQFSKALIKNSLVFLFADIKKKEPISFIVTNTENLEHFEIGITPFNSAEFEKLNFNSKYLMLESPVFFKAYETVLQTLKKIQEVPFAPLILHLNSEENKNPLYLENDQQLDISPIIKKNSDIDDENKEIENKESFTTSLLKDKIARYENGKEKVENLWAICKSHFRNTDTSQFKITDIINQCKKDIEQQLLLLEVFFRLNQTKIIKGEKIIAKYTKLFVKWMRRKGEICFFQGNLNEALSLSKKGLRYAQKISESKEIFNFHLLLGKIFRKKLNFYKAYDHIKSCFLLRPDSLKALQEEKEIKECLLTDPFFFLKKNDDKYIINPIKSWVPNEETILNPSENDALKNCCRNKLTLIVGPPGTGKTFLARKIARILGKKSTGVPLLLIALTNHALDAFMEPLQPYFSKMVRIGTRSRSKDLNYLKKTSIRELTKGMGTSEENRKLYTIFSELEEDYEKLKRISELRFKVKKPSDLFKRKDLKQFFRPIINSFKDQCKKENVNPNLSSKEIIEKWVSGMMINSFLKKKRIEKRKEIEAKNQSSNPFQVLVVDENENSNNNQRTNANDDVTEDQVEILEEDDELDDIEEDDDDEEMNTRNEKTKLRDEEMMLDALDEEEEKEKKRKFAIDELLNQGGPNQSISEEKRFYFEELIKEREREEESRKENLKFEEDNEENQFFLQNKRIKSNFSLSVEVTSLFSLITTDLKKENPWEMKGRRKFIEKVFFSLLKKLEQMENVIFRNVEKLELKKREIYDERERRCLSKVQIVACTSTMASMRRNMFEKLAPKILIIEESGELLEAEHLILIGDEKQLQPKIQMFKLRKKNFHISMFERFVKNKFEHSVLTVQHRMRPEIADIMKILFYPYLENHESVKKYPDVSGMNQNLLFINHNEPESTSEYSRSKSNKYEAEMTAGLLNYLLTHKEYSEDDVTVITPYLGQKFEIKRILRSKYPQINLKKQRIEVLDDFQGEENKVIILSLVRSKITYSDKETIGFLKIRNRIIVGLSRAKEGMYIFGNAELLKNKSDDWNRIIRLLEERNQVKQFWEAKCVNHGDQITRIQSYRDLGQIKKGGCNKICNFRFECGHLCSRMCHLDSHFCKEICGKKNTKCSRNHLCKNLCHFGKECPACEVLIDVKLECGHKTKIKCSYDPKTVKCNEKCGKLLPCGHKCGNSCYQCSEYCKQNCTKKLKKKCSACGKFMIYTCNTEPYCKNKCPIILECGHRCANQCGTCTREPLSHICRSKCSKLLICGHKCKGKHKCSDFFCKQCPKKCEFSCSHSVNCKKKCGQQCIFCKNKCQIRCIHSLCEKKCWEICARKPCNFRCQKILKCKHRCCGLCGERCPPCLICNAKNKKGKKWRCELSNQSSIDIVKKIEDEKNMTKVYVLQCNHVFVFEALDQYIKENSNSLKFIGCPICNSPISNVGKCRRYQKEIKNSLFIQNKYKKAVLYTKNLEKSSFNIERFKKLINSVFNDLKKRKRFDFIIRIYKTLVSLPRKEEEITNENDDSHKNWDFIEEIRGIVDPNDVDANMFQLEIEEQKNDVVYYDEFKEICSDVELAFAKFSTSKVVKEIEIESEKKISTFIDLQNITFKIVKGILNIKNVLSTKINESFGDRFMLSRRFKNFISKFIDEITVETNLDNYGGKEKRFSGLELLAYYSNEVLLNNSERSIELSSKLHQIYRFIKDLTDRDTFFLLYYNYLQRRLLNDNFNKGRETLSIELLKKMQLIIHII